MLIHFHLAAAVGLQADVFQSQLIGVAGTAVAPEQGVGLDLLAGFQVQDHAVLLTFDALVLFVVANRHVVVAQVITQRLGNLVVEEAEQLVTVVDQIDQYPKATENRRVLTTDHAGAVDDQTTRGVAKAEDGVAVVNPRMVEVDIQRTIRTRTGGNHHLLGDHGFHHPIGAHHLNGLGVGKAGGTTEHIDAIARVVTGARTDLLGDHPLGAFQHIGKGEPARLTDLAEQRIGVVLHDLPYRVTQGLGRDSAQMRAVAAHQATVIDHRHLAPGLGRIHGRPLARRAGTQHHHVVVVDRHAYSSITGRARRSGARHDRGHKPRYLQC